MYVQDKIQEWVEQYEPDTWSYTTDNSKPELRRGAGLCFGNLVVSIQWSEVNYCDHYIGKSYFTFNPSPIYKGQYKKVREAEVAIICRGRYDFRREYTSTHFISYDGYDSVRAYATIAEIEEILSVCADYAQA